MKRLIILALLCLAGSVFANDIQVTLRDSISVADTNAARGDTVYSEWVPIHGAQKIHLFVDVFAIGGSAVDTNFADDSFFVDVQLSFDKGNVTKKFLIDTLLDTGLGWPGVADDKADLLAADSLRGNYMRARFIHRALDIGGPGFLNKVYGKKLKLWFVLIK